MQLLYGSVWTTCRKGSIDSMFMFVMLPVEVLHTCCVVTGSERILAYF
jgi:hypothetical protein